MHLWSKVTALSSKVEATMVLVQTMRGNDSVNQVFEQLKAVRTRVSPLLLFAVLVLTDSSTYRSRYSKAV
jgi:orotidine-5'-phosphate decarboxylase